MTNQDEIKKKNKQLCRAKVLERREIPNNIAMSQPILPPLPKRPKSTKKKASKDNGKRKGPGLVHKAKRQKVEHRSCRGKGGKKSQGRGASKRKIQPSNRPSKRTKKS